MSRALKVNERAIIERLLEDSFQGRDAIRAQIEQSRVRVIDEYQDNYGSLEFEVRGGPKARVAERVPVDAMALDSDGVPIEFLLHVVDGFLKELEVVKADGSPILRYPQAADLTVSVRGVA